MHGEEGGKPDYVTKELVANSLLAQLEAASVKDKKLMLMELLDKVDSATVWALRFAYGFKREDKQK